MKKTFVIKHGHVSFEVRGTRLLTYEKGPERRNFPISYIEAVAMCAVLGKNIGYKTQHGVSKLELMKMVFRGIDEMDFANKIGGMFYDHRYTKQFIEAMDVKSRYGMSKSTYGRFMIDVDGDGFGPNDLEKDSPKTHRDTCRAIGAVMNGIVVNCRTKVDLNRMLNAISYDSREEKFGALAYEEKKIMWGARDEIFEILKPYWCGIIDDWVKTYRKTEIKIQEMLGPCKWVWHEDADMYFWIRGKKIAYHGNLINRPHNICKGIYAHIAGMNVSELLETVKLLENNGITFQDIMAQCREEITEEDVLKRVKGVIHKNHGILQFPEMGDYNDGTLSERQFEKIWNRAMNKNFLDGKGFIKDCYSENRAIVQEMFSHWLPGRFLQDTECDRRIEQYYERYCENKLGEYIESEQEKVLARKRKNAARPRGGKIMKGVKI